MTYIKPWLDQYDRGVPRHIDYPSISVPDFFLQKSALYADCPFLHFGQQRYSYAECAAIIRRVAQSLLIHGLVPGERVGVCLPNIPEFVLLFYGIMAAGGVVVALNPAYPEREMEFHLRSAEVTVMAGLGQNQSMLEKLAKENRIRQMVLIDSTKPENSRSVDDFVKPEILHFEELLKEVDTSVELPDLNADLPAVLQFSGGTTGIPKPAMITHANLVANSLQFRAWLSNLEDGKEVFMAAIPLYHVYGMVIALNVAMTMGAEVVLVSDPRDVSVLLETIQQHKVSFFPAVPTLFHAINQHPGVKAGGYNLRSVKVCISGSAPLHNEIRRKFEELTGGKLVEGYGLTEAPTATHCNPIQGENRPGSIGLPLPDVDCRIVELDKPEQDVNPGEPGELLIRSPQVMKGYYGQSEETCCALANGWLHTGDIARMDGDGYFYIIGRLKELIKVNGLQVWPREVEEVLVQIPGVKDAAVAGIPDLAKGEKVKAWIEADALTNLNAEKIIAVCRELLVHYKVPSEVEFVQSIPKSGVGKVLRRKLVEMDLETKKREP